MKPAMIIRIIQSSITPWIPELLDSVKNPESKAQMKESVPALRAIADSLIEVANEIDDVVVKPKPTPAPKPKKK